MQGAGALAARDDRDRARLAQPARSGRARDLSRVVLGVVHRAGERLARVEGGAMGDLQAREAIGRWVGVNTVHEMFSRFRHSKFSTI